MTLLELILSEILDKNQCPPPFGRRAEKPVGSLAKNGGVLGEEIFCPGAKNVWVALETNTLHKNRKVIKYQIK